MNTKNIVLSGLLIVLFAFSVNAFSFLNTNSVAVSKPVASISKLDLIHSCTDSDGGDFPYLPGFITGYGYNGEYIYHDECVSGTTLLERICVGDGYQIVQHSCPMGCWDRRCHSSLLGDTNCDGYVNVDDVDSFVIALVNPGRYSEEYPYCQRENADCNGDGLINAFDIDPFAAMLNSTTF